MTSIQNVRELFAVMMLTGNIKYCHEQYYSKLLKIIDLKTENKLLKVNVNDYSIKKY